MIRLFSKTIILWLAISYFSPLSANHIIGGVMTYKCLGNDDYEITTKIYRDCNCQSCAFFDPELPIGIYKCGTNINCSSLDQTSTFATAFPIVDSITLVDIPDYPCLIPPDVCVQQATYIFTVNLPLSTESYHLTYQRCCRNATINNILLPNETGATFTIEITPEAQAVCNNSPVFNSFPPIVICADQPLEYDHSATDPDGDLLLYKFCPPLEGAGYILDGSLVETCQGVFPNPGCPPPYGGVSFTLPSYSTLTPMGGNPVISIDPLTGLITGTPNLTGQFVVGVCVEEYRNGVLLGKVFRDFQFNVTPCDPLVVADVLEDEEITPQEFVLNSCGNTTVNIPNQSYQQQFIDDWQWDFEIDGSLTSFTEWSPTIDFQEAGQYNGLLILNPNTACGDTAIIHVNIFPTVEADFSFDYDTCVAGPVVFTDLSTTGSCCLTSWSWEFGDGGYSISQNPEHEYLDPGDYEVRLTARDTNQCESITKNYLAYYPLPEIILIAPDTYSGCEPAEIYFDNLSSPINASYDILWHFGDGQSSSDLSPLHTYINAGLFTVDVFIASPVGCEVSNTFSDLINIEASPLAGFSFTPQETSILEPEVTFTDESLDAASIYWTFGDGFSSSLPNPVHTYRDTGFLAISQIVTHLDGCKDTLIQYLDIRPEVRYFLPNAFTPNNDSVNENYKGVGILEGVKNFNFSIWNRWGELVFETQDPDQGWNGLKFNTGRPAPQGEYVVKVSYIDPRGHRVEHKGFATLIR